MAPTVASRSRKFKNYTQKSLENAFSAIKNGMSERLASPTFKIPRGTLQNRRHHRHIGPFGRPTVFTDIKEITIANNLATVADWGFHIDLKILVKSMLDRQGRSISIFGNKNIPGDDWVRSFLERRKDIIRIRMCQNISCKRAKVTKEDIENYFKNLTFL